MSGAATFAHDHVFPAENDTSWRNNAACLGVDPDLFFPPQGGATNGAEAKQICGGCPVQAECLDYAVTTAQKYGIWGGTNERERREIRKQRGLIVKTEPACGTIAGYRRHQNRNQPTCTECKAAMARYQARRKRQQNPERRAATA
ncbi:WhiB family transcriptional regulator [uncultured Thermomonospora sp.]|uniref:WhiB family transcriptional regulator n=1 Tax=uncultured Thermomonospora sp. TaxID=671175 RepID=UPI00259B2394|nr:WhiB family transcriptional regulator [uncultured Thermomonospora sp.]